MEHTSLHNEKELLIALAAGDEQAFRKLYEYYWDKVYSIGLYYFRSPVAAQDAVQEVFLRLWIKRRKLKNVENFSAYLNQVSRNLIIDLLRGKVLELSPLIQEEKEGPQVLPQHQLEAKEVAAYIREAINQLPPQQRLVYNMGKEQGLPLKEVAAQLGISYNTAREHMSQALRNIRQFLKEHLGHLYVLALLFMQL